MTGEEKLPIMGAPPLTHQEKMAAALAKNKALEHAYAAGFDPANPKKGLFGCNGCAACLPAAYFTPCACEMWRGGLVYRVLGAGLFKALLRRMPCYGRPFQAAKSEEEVTRARTVYIGSTINLETVHVWLVFMFFLAWPLQNLIVLGKDHVWDMTSLPTWVVLQVVLNVAPILVQRYNRARLYVSLGFASAPPDDMGCCCCC